MRSSRSVENEAPIFHHRGISLKIIANLRACGYARTIEIVPHRPGIDRAGVRPSTIRPGGPPWGPEEFHVKLADLSRVLHRSSAV
jgi:hypothetical protein